MLPTATARLDLSYCLGYEDCYKQTGMGFAFFCVKDPQHVGHWYCMECESCGNGPWGGTDLRVDGLPVVA